MSSNHPLVDVHFLSQYYWHRGNPNQHSEDDSTDSDTSRTEVTQNRHTNSPCDESSTEPKPEDATNQIHFSDISDTPFYAPGVPKAFPDSIPLAVLEALRHWDEIPRHIRTAVTALFMGSSADDNEHDRG
jgi:hypothetical protein